MTFHIAHNNGENISYSQVGISQQFSTGQPDHETFDSFDEWIIRLNELGVDASEIEEQHEEVPESVENYKLEIVLDEEGLLTQVEQAVSQASKRVQIAWNQSPTIRRDSKSVNELAGVLGLTDRLDELFIKTQKVRL